MKLSRWLSPILLLPLAAATPTSPPADPAELLEAERGLNHDARALGVRDAFLEWLSPTAIEFRPGPTNARQIYAALGRTRTGLTREPWRLVMSSSGDLGWTTGRWAFRADSGKSKVDVDGEYATLWRRQRDGRWQIAFDGGLPHRVPGRTEAALPPEKLPAGPRGSGPLERRHALWQVDANFAKAATAGLPAALATYGAEQIILLRQGMPRVVGLAAARESLAARERTAVLVSTAQFVSDSGDLGYTYGSFVERDAAAPDSAWYLHVWQRGRTRPWELVLDYVQPQPRPKRR